MNYRHAYHAGNFADCFKHALLVAIVEDLKRKSAPFFVLDTHAGAGRYDLEAEQSRRTAESQTGICRLLQSHPSGLGNYLPLVKSLGLYPGSPALVRGLLRPEDRLCCCELHPEDVMSLRRMFRDDRQVAVHHRSGWEALAALLPPKEKRGFVLIDPPFENQDEFGQLANGLARGYRRFAHGIFAAWYPIKGLSVIRSFMEDVMAKAIRNVVSIELRLREPVDAGRLNGCGLLVVNPPFKLLEQADRIVEALLVGFGQSEPGASAVIRRVSDE